MSNEHIPETRHGDSCYVFGCRYCPIHFRALSDKLEHETKCKSAPKSEIPEAMRKLRDIEEQEVYIGQ